MEAINKLIFSGLLLLASSASLFAAGGTNSAPAATPAKPDAGSASTAADSAPHGGGNTQGDNDGTAPTVLQPEPDEDAVPAAAGNSPQPAQPAQNA